MFSFLSEILKRRHGPFTVIVMDEAQLEAPVRHRLDPRNVFGLAGGIALGSALLMVIVLVFSPVRELIPGYGTTQMQQEVRLASLRLAAVHDSLQAQIHYITQLRGLMTGQLDTAALGAAPEAARPDFQGLPVEEMPPTTLSRNWADHEQPALILDRLPFRGGERPVPSSSARYLSSLRFPLAPPVTGFYSRGFDARNGHYAIDIAVEEGTVVRSIGDGYVILADWTHEGGYTLTVQHADGYVSVYKHNQRLLKRIGDRVRYREAIALSGNTGMVTSGPHLHFELWHNGLAQDPRGYFIGG
jgi:murein DD-endopeptidase MepM/ murein hydrolase activator NlpD